MESEKIETEKGFGIRLETRIKNEALIGARESLDLTAKAVSEAISISYSKYIAYESMKSYPSAENQKKICQFYRDHEIFLFEDDVFPEELMAVKLKARYILESRIPKDRLISLTEADQKLLPQVSAEIEEELDRQDLTKEIDYALSRLKPRQESILRDCFGIGTEKLLVNQIEEKYALSSTRVGQIRDKAIQKIQFDSRNSSTLKSYLGQNL